MSRLLRLERLERHFGRRCGPLPFGVVTTIAANGEQPAIAAVREMSRTWPPLLLRTWVREEGEGDEQFIARVRDGAADGALLLACS